MYLWKKLVGEDKKVRSPVSGLNLKSLLSRLLVIVGVIVFHGFFLLRGGKMAWKRCVNYSSSR